MGLGIAIIEHSVMLHDFLYICHMMTLSRGSLPRVLQVKVL
jgi:hypothetical protein